MTVLTCRVAGCGADTEDTNPGVDHAIGRQPAHHHVTCARCGVVHRVSGADVTIDAEETFEALRAAQAAYAPFSAHEPLSPGRPVPVHNPRALAEATECLELAERGATTLARLGPRP